MPASVNIVTVTRTRDILDRLRRIFAAEEYSVSGDADLDHVLERLESQRIDVLLITSLAIRDARYTGMELLEVLLAKSPKTQILFLAEERDLDLAMSALKAGSYQYAMLPISNEELRMLILAALEAQPRVAMEFEEGPLQRRFGELVGSSPKMQVLYRLIRQASATDIPVLITGETGTGKDLVAEAIHRKGERRNGPYIAVHLGALPPELVASELFGHEKGAFTGANTARPGQFELTQDGSIFLDEIGTIDERIQISLLRIIEQKEFNRIGGQKNVQSNARIIAATNEDLEKAVEEGRFREDLFYRLDVFHINVPPLRKRYGDIALLIEEFIARYNRDFQKNVQGISPNVLSILESYDWPGNVRELKNVVQRAVLLCTGDVLKLEHLPPRFALMPEKRPTISIELGTSLSEVERIMIAQALAFAPNRKAAAEMLGISRRSLYNKIKEYGL